jgi:hypothetical protein
MKKKTHTGPWRARHGIFTEGVGDEDDGGLGPGGAADVGLLPAEVVNDLASSAGRLQRRRVLKAARTCHASSPSSFFSFVSGTKTFVARRELKHYEPYIDSNSRTIPCPEKVKSAGEIVEHNILSVELWYR